MPRQWTDEQRREASERAKARGFGRKGTQASVEVKEVPPVGRSNAEVFLAEHEGVVETTTDRETEEGMPVTTTHTRPGTTVMYKPGRDGYSPRTVSVSALRLLIRQGWQEHCPDCGKDHLNKAGEHSSDPNLCAAKPPVAVRICPVCQHRIYDNMPFEEQAPEEEDDPNVITEVAYEDSTPESRTKAALDVHLWRNHPRQAQERNVPPLPTALRPLVEGANKA